jgi:7-cyano-7-deazaguanine synthase in queuosine biosynthesis
MEIMSKKVIVFLSGGIDSTYLLIKNLELGNEVYPFYLDIDHVNHRQREQERNAVEKILLNLEVLSLDKKFNLKKLKLAKVNWLPTLQAMQMPQLFVTWGWLLSMSQDYRLGINFDEIQIGYCLGDDALGFMDQIRNLWQSFTAFTNYEYDSTYHDPTPPKLCFPISMVAKESFYHYLHENYPKILINCWWCEKPYTPSASEIKKFGFPKEAIPCGDCPSCKRMREKKLLPILNSRYALINKEGILNGDSDRKSEDLSYLLANQCAVFDEETDDMPIEKKNDVSLGNIMDNLDKKICSIENELKKLKTKKEKVLTWGK